MLWVAQLVRLELERGSESVTVKNASSPAGFEGEEMLIVLQVSGPGTPERSRWARAGGALGPLVRMRSLSANLCQASCPPEEGPRVPHRGSVPLSLFDGERHTRKLVKLVNFI